jgi:hypothetical protein
MEKALCAKPGLTSAGRGEAAASAAAAAALERASPKTASGGEQSDEAQQASARGIASQT